jgi:iron complex outermembrane recepter protein
LLKSGFGEGSLAEVSSLTFQGADPTIDMVTEVGLASQPELNVNKGSGMKHRAVASLHASVALIVLCCAASAQAIDSREVAVSIQRQPVLRALREWGNQTGMQLLVRVDNVALNAVMSPAVEGTLTPRAALEKLLTNSGLRYQLVNDHTVSISRPRVEPSSRLVGVEDKSLRVAQGSTPASDVTPGTRGAVPDARSGGPIAEVVVSAQKRSELLQDVPVPVTAISAGTLVSSNQLRLQDYYMKIPGLNATPGDLSGGSRLTIRGLTTGGSTNPTVGVVVDDVPFGSSVGQGGGSEAPDIDPNELSRIEVLRGPQGTLYGASSLGGLFKFVTVDPSTEALSGRVQAGLSSVRNGDELGFNVRGDVNVPVSDKWALRGSAFTRRDPGFIDDPILGIEGVNGGESHGGRLSTLWRPTEDVSLKLSALFQNSKLHGSPLVYQQAGLGELEQTAARGSGGYAKDIQAYGANLSARLGNVDVVAASGYGIYERSFWFDLTPFFGAFTDSLFGVEGTPSNERDKVTKFTQEVRLSSTMGERFEWLLGAFYTDEDTPQTQSILATDFTTGAAEGTVADISFPNTYEEWAAFGNLIVHATDRLTIQFGARQSENQQTYSQFATGPLFGGDSVVPETRTKDDAFTYLVTPSFKVSSDLMVYARLASGYRPGGPNSNCVALNVPCKYDADTTQNYEIGFKGSALEDRVSFDASVYYIDWKDIQLRVIDPATVTGYNANGSRARSQGIELAAEVRPTNRLSVVAWVAWNEAELTEPLPSGGPGTPVGSPGDRLPYSNRFSGSVSVDQEFSITGNMNAYVGGSVSYVGDREGMFQGTPERQPYPGYAQTDLRAGVRFDTWTVNAFVNNATDKRVVLIGGLDYLLPGTFAYIQPRTAGVSLSKSF